MQHVNRLKDFLRNRSVRGAGILGFAALISAGVSLVAIPFIARIYTPATFGSYALLAALVATFSTVVSGRYEMMCVVAPHDESGVREAWAAARLSLGITALLGALGFSVVTIFLSVWGENLQSDTWMVWALTPIGVCLGAFTSVQALLDTRLANYRLLATLYIARVVIMASGQILLGLGWPTIVSLSIPLFLSNVPSLLRLIQLMHLSPGGIDASYWQYAKAHWKFPVFQVPAALANSLSGNILLFSLTATYGAATAGFFSIATRLTGFPASAFGNPVNTVYFREASRLVGDRRNSLALYVRVVSLLILLGLVLFGLMYALSPYLVLVLGPEWSAAQGMILATIPMGFSLLITAPPNSALISHGGQGQLLVWRLLLVVGPPIVILVGPVFDWSSTTVTTYASVLLLISTLVYVLWGIRTIKRGRADL